VAAVVRFSNIEPPESGAREVEPADQDWFEGETHEEKLKREDNELIELILLGAI
jgi:hypothetical protein